MCFIYSKDDSEVVRHTNNSKTWYLREWCTNKTRIPQKSGNITKKNAKFSISCKI